jgi:hypothetical protein
MIHPSTIRNRQNPLELKRHDILWEIISTKVRSCELDSSGLGYRPLTSSGEHGNEPWGLHRTHVSLTHETIYDVTTQFR